MEDPRYLVGLNKLLSRCGKLAHSALQPVGNAQANPFDTLKRVVIEMRHLASGTSGVVSLEAIPSADQILDEDMQHAATISLRGSERLADSARQLVERIDDWSPAPPRKFRRKDHGRIYISEEGRIADKTEVIEIPPSQDELQAAKESNTSVHEIRTAIAQFINALRDTRQQVLDQSTGTTAIRRFEGTKTLAVPDPAASTEPNDAQREKDSRLELSFSFVSETVELRRVAGKETKNIWTIKDLRGIPLKLFFILAENFGEPVTKRDLYKLWQTEPNVRRPKTANSAGIEQEPEPGESSLPGMIGEVRQKVKVPDLGFAITNFTRTGDNTSSCTLQHKS